MCKQQWNLQNSQQYVCWWIFKYWSSQISYVTNMIANLGGSFALIGNKYADMQSSSRQQDFEYHRIWFGDWPTRLLGLSSTQNLFKNYRRGGVVSCLVFSRIFNIAKLILTMASFLYEVLYTVIEDIENSCQFFILNRNEHIFIFITENFYRLFIIHLALQNSF